MATLNDILKDLDDNILLSDGANTWDKWNLIDSITENGEGNMEVALREHSDGTISIVAFGKEGYQNSQALYIEVSA